MITINYQTAVTQLYNKVMISVIKTETEVKVLALLAAELEANYPYTLYLLTISCELE